MAQHREQVGGAARRAANDARELEGRGSGEVRGHDDRVALVRGGDHLAELARVLRVAGGVADGPVRLPP